MLIGEDVRSDTVAVVGGGAIRKMEMAANAHAFKMLSDTLYSNKKLAVVREVICNAIDAHIITNQVETPVRVTLSDSEFRVRDFGPGIHDDNIVDIACTYFSSTKGQDASQTGGFGLGFKAPFAYTDHFTVHSCHQGVKTIYVIHVGDEDSGGAPGLRVMGSVPTQETGIEVIVPIDLKDRSEFRDLIKEVVFDGGMNVALNDVQLPSADYSLLRHYGYGIVQNRYSTGQISVLFGNVLYKIEGMEDISLDVARRFRDRLPLGNARLLLLAPPSSVVPVPSREALSMTDKTVATLTALIEDAVRGVERVKQSIFRDVLRRALGSLERARYVAYGPHGGLGRMKMPWEDHTYGPEAIAFHIAVYRIKATDFTYHDLIIANRKLGRPALRFIPYAGGYDLRGNYKPESRFAETCSGSTAITNALIRDRHRFLNEVILKVISKAECFEHLRYKARNYSRCLKVNEKKFDLTRLPGESSDEFDKRRVRVLAGRIIEPTELALTIAPNLDEAMGSEFTGYCLMANKLSAKVIAGLKTHCERYGVKLEIIKGKEKEPVEAKPKKPYPVGHAKFVGPLEDKTRLRPLRLPRSENDEWRTPGRTLEKADYYFEPKELPSYARSKSAEFVALLAQFIPGTCALLVDEDDRRRIEEVKLPSFEDLLMVALRKRMKTKKLRRIDRLAVLLTFMEGYSARMGVEFRGWGRGTQTECRSVYDFLGKLVPNNAELVAEFLDPKVKFGDLQSALAFWKLMKLSFMTREDIYGVPKAHMAKFAEHYQVFETEIAALAEEFFLINTGVLHAAEVKLRTLISSISIYAHWSAENAAWMRFMVKQQLVFHNLKGKNA